MDKDYEDVDVTLEDEDDDVIEYVYEKDRSPRKGKKEGWRKAKKRLKEMKASYKFDFKHPLAYFRNSDEAGVVKAKSEKAHTKKSANSVKDTKRIDSMNSDLVEG